MDRFDRIVWGVIAGLILAIGAVIGLGDHVGVVRDVIPADQSHPPVTTPIRITFSEQVDAASAESRLSFDPAIEGTIRWEEQTLIFQPTSPLLAGQQYTMTLAAGVTSESGRRLSRALNWSFRPREPRVLYLAPANGQVRSLWSVPVDGGEPTLIFAPEFGIFSYAPSFDGSQLAVAVYREDLATDLWLTDADGSHARQITDCAPGQCGSAAWSPDGTLIAYERQEAASGGVPGPSRVWLLDLATGETSPVFQDNQVLGYGPVWSPDGSRLAFFDASVRAIRVLPLSGGDTIVIPSQMGEVGTFSPDGSTMIYTDIRPVGRQFFAELWMASFDAEGGLQPFLEDAEEDQGAVWSPDGKWVAFVRRRLDRTTGFASQLMLYRPETGEFRQATDDPQVNNTLLRWSPAGGWLLVQRFNLEAPNAASELWLYNLDSGEMTLLVDDAFGGQWLP